jgi:ubiquinone/menaquinone biosynthesis C-methylase UbiE
MEMKYKISSKGKGSKKISGWGTYAWFLHQADSDEASPASYFAHGLNGYQQFRHEALVNFLRKNLRDEELNNIVDVGCGSGDLLESIRLEFNVGTALGIDFIEKVLQVARNNFPELEFSLSALPKLPVSKDSADMVVVSEVLYYLSDEDRLTALNKIYDALKPGGYIFFTSVLGKEYFIESSAKALIESKFEIKNLGFLHNRLYHYIKFLPHRILRFGELLQKNKIPGSDKNRVIFERFEPWFKTSFSQMLLRFLLKPCSLFMASPYVPKICEWLAKYMGKRFRGNILILAQKRVEI